MAETKELEKRQKKSKEYWKKRASQREREAYARGAALSARLYRQYEKAAVQIRKEINDWYMRYAKENKLTYDQAVKLLSRREMQEWKGTIGQYVDQINSISDEAIKAKMKSQLDALSYNSSITRLESLYSQIDAIMSDTFARGVDEMKAEFGEAFRQGYYKKLYDIQNRVGYMQEIAHIGPKMIENVVSYPWTGVMFSDRIWRNKEALIFNMRETITQGLIQGKSIASMSKQLADNMGRSYKAAERVIRTETNHFHNEAEKHAYLASGIKEYEYMATLDSRTCEECGRLDGKRFPVAEARPGENFPPLHPNDRCTTIEYDPEDAVDWAVSGQPMPKNMTYKEWAKQQNIPAPQKKDTGDDEVFQMSNFESVRKNMLKRIDKSNGIPENIDMLKKQVMETPCVVDKTMEGPCAYNRLNDEIRYNPSELEFYDIDQVYVHELMHRADVKDYQSWKDPEFNKAIESCAKKIYADFERIERLFQEGGKYYYDDCLCDIMSALTNDQMKLPAGHSEEYWNQNHAKALEIFADIGCMDALGLEGKNEFEGVLSELYRAFIRIVKG